MPPSFDHIHCLLSSQCPASGECLLTHACLAQLSQIIYYQWDDKGERRKTGRPSVILYRRCVFLDLLVHGPTAWAKLFFLPTWWNPVIHYILVLFLKGASPASNYRMDSVLGGLLFLFFLLLHFVQQKKPKTYMGCTVYYVYIYSALLRIIVNTLKSFYTQTFVIVIDFSVFIPKIKTFNNYNWYSICFFVLFFAIKVAVLKMPSNWKYWI